jgi:antitoxin (DNA-binding transcriptional repressor) of toxin-antitoxin stability system
MANIVSAAYAKANLPKLLKEAENGKSIVIARYKKPVAMIVPAPAEKSEKQVRRFGTGKGRVRIIDPHWADPMTDEEVEAFVEGRY